MKRRGDAVLALPRELGFARPVAAKADLDVARSRRRARRGRGGTSASRASARRRTPPCRCPCACRSGRGRRGRARADTARTFGSVIEWSPPRTTGTTPAASDLADRRLDLQRASVGVGRHDRASPKSTTRSSANASIPASRCGPGGQLAARIARGPKRVPGPVGDEVVGRRADDRDVETLELRGIVRVRHARVREEPRVVGLVGKPELAPALERVDHAARVLTTA